MAEPLEARTLLSSVTLTGTAGNDAFLATLDAAGTTVQFYVNASPATGTPVATVPLASFSGLVVNGGGGADSLTFAAAGAAVPLDASGTAALSVEVDAGTVAVTSAQSLAAVTIDAAGTLTLTGSGSLTLGAGGLTAPGGSPAVTVGPGLTLATPVGTVAGGATLAVNGAGTIAAGSWTVSNATVRQTAGTVAVGSLLQIGGTGDPAATAYDLVAGTLTTPSLYVGAFSGGTLTQSGGSATSGHTEVGTAGNGFLEQSAGIATWGDTYLGYYYGSGHLDLSGTAIAAVTGLADGVYYGTGSVTLAGTASLTASGQEGVGESWGAGTFVQTGGTNATPSLAVGAYGPAGTGSYTLSGGTLTAGAEYVGLDYWQDQPSGSERGTFTQSGGVNNVGASSLWVGYYAGSVGTYTLTGGTLADAGLLVVGLLGVGTLDLSGSGQLQAAAGYVGDGGPVAGGLSGTVEQSGGSATFAGPLYVGGDSGSATPTPGTQVGLYDLSGGTLSTASTYVGFGDDAAFDQSGGTHSTGLVVVDGPLGTTGIYGRYGGHLDSDGGVVDALHPAADGGGSNATTVLREGSTFTLPLSAAPGAGSYPLAGYTVDWGDGQPGSTPAASDTSATHPYADGGRTDTAQANAVYGSGSNARSVPANPVAVQVVDVPAQVTSVHATTTPDNGSPTDVGTVTVTAPFTDPGVGEHHQATIDWGDDTPLATSGAGGSVTVTDNPDGSGTITATHDYATSGTYTPTLQVTDDAGGTPGNGLATYTFSTTLAYVTPTFGLTPIAAPAGTSGGSPAGPGVGVSVTAGGPNAGGVAGWSIDWGDGSKPTAVSGTGVQNAGRYSWPVQTHVYAAAGHYVISATPTDQAGTHAAAVGTTVAVAEPSPTGLTATAVDDEDVQLTWTPDPAAGTQYEVDRQNPDGTWAAIATVDDSVEGDTYTDSGLSGLQPYAYRVRAVGGTPDLNSAYTAPASATTTLTTPDAPTGVSATESTPGEVDLTWAEDSTIVTGYIVTATPLGGGGAPITSMVGGEERITAIGGLTLGASYAFAVVADNDQSHGNDVQSAPSAAIFAFAPSSAMSATAPATKGEGLSFAVSLEADAPTGIGSRIVALQVTWSDGTVQSFPSYTAGTILTDNYTVPTTAQSDTATVVATDAVGHTFLLPPVDVEVVPTAPTDVATSVVSGTEVDLSWTDASQSATGYEVLRADGGSADFEDVADLPAGTTTYADTTVEPATEYAFELEATGGTLLATASPATPAAGGPVTTPAVQLTLTAAPAELPTAADLTVTYNGPADSGFELEEEDLTAGTNFQLVTQPSAITPGGPAEIVVLGVTPGNQYQFRIRADLADGTVTAYTTTSLNLPEVGGPTLTATHGVYGADLSWSGGADTADGYVLQYRPSQTALWMWYGSPVHVPGTSISAYVGDPGLSFDYRVRADDGGASWSNVAQATADPVPGDPSDEQIDAQVSVSMTDATHCHITWGSGTANVTFGIALITIGSDPPRKSLWDDGTPPGTYRDTDQYGAGATSVDLPVAPGPFVVQVIARGVDDGTHAREVGYGYAVGGQLVTAPPAAPDKTWASIVGFQGHFSVATFVWHNSSDNEDGFKIELSPNQYFTDGADELTETDATTFTTPLATFKTVYYRVAAYKGNMQSAWINGSITPSNQVIVLLQGDNLTGITAGPVNITHESVGLGHYNDAGDIVVDSAWSFGGDGHAHYFAPELKWLGFPFPPSIEGMGGPHSIWDPEGAIYKTDGFGDVVQSKPVTPAQAEHWRVYMGRRNGTTDIYDPGFDLVHGPSLDCRRYSQLEYSYAPEGLSDY